MSIVFHEMQVVQSSQTQLFHTIFHQPVFYENKTFAFKIAQNMLGGRSHIVPKKREKDSWPIVQAFHLIPPENAGVEKLGLPVQFPHPQIKFPTPRMALHVKFPAPRRRLRVKLPGYARGGGGAWECFELICTLPFIKSGQKWGVFLFRARL